MPAPLPGHAAPWEEVASKAPVRKGKGKSKAKGKGGKGKGQAEASEHFASWAETFS